jgi:hypothetical protein
MCTDWVTNNGACKTTPLTIDSRQQTTDSIQQTADSKRQTSKIYQQQDAHDDGFFAEAPDRRICHTAADTMLQSNGRHGFTEYLVWLYRVTDLG